MPRVVAAVLYLLVTVLTLVPTCATARSWYVTPDGTGDAPTIAAALDSCAGGDDVLLAPGTYYEHDLLLPQGITLHSEAGRDLTTIDGQGLGPVLVAQYIEETTVEGITVQHGSASSGGGLSSYLAWIVIRDCRFRENHATREGGGVYSLWGGLGITSVTNTVFEGNDAGDAGGGLHIVYEPTLPASKSSGWPPWPSPIEISGCSFIGNSTGLGGGAYFDLVSVTVSGCSFQNNDATVWGGGLLLGSWGDWEVDNCTFQGNQASGNGGAMLLYNAEFETPDLALVRGCLLTGNSAERGAGIYASSTLGSPLSFSLQSSTVTENTATLGGGLFSEFADVTLESSIIAFNTNHGLYPEYSGSPPPVSCCDVFGNAGGNYANGMPDPTGTDGNISIDPLFCAPVIGDYHLDAASPCLDAAGCGLMGAFGQGCDGTTTAVPEGAVESTSWGRLKKSF